MNSAYHDGVCLARQPTEALGCKCCLQQCLRLVDVPTYVLLVHENESCLDSGTEFFGEAQELLTRHECSRMGQASEEHTGKHHVG